MLTLPQTEELLFNLRRRPVLPASPPLEGSQQYINKNPPLGPPDGRLTRRKQSTRNEAHRSRWDSIQRDRGAQRRAARVKRGALALPENKWPTPIRYKIDAEIG